MRSLAICAVISVGVWIGHAQPQTSAARGVAPQTVTLRWGARAGISRYRLQLANDVSFTDIVLDRVITGVEYRVSDLPVGKYFWRVAPIGSAFAASSAGVIEIRAADNAANNKEETTPVAATKPAQGPKTSGGWYAAIGNTTAPILAHLRSTLREDIMAVSGSRVLALDTASGVELWNTRLNSQPTVAPLGVKSPNRLDNILVVSANVAALLDGTTGRARWQARLPATVSTAVAAEENIFLIDNSLAKVFVVKSATGQVIAQARLPHHAVGAPALIEIEPRSVMIAMDDGSIQVIDGAGKVLRSGRAESAATTPPLFVRSTRGNFVLVGTKEGLTALNATDLRPLGRINLKGDIPRGALAAADLDRDRNPEVIMFTERGQVFVVKSDEGRILWTADARHAEALAFADVNDDDAVDLLMMGKEGLAFALSGRDGAVLWREETPAIAANHAPGARLRSLAVVRTPSGTLLITGDAGGGLRATAFSARTSH